MKNQLKILWSVAILLTVLGCKKAVLQQMLIDHINHGYSDLSLISNPGSIDICTS
ncbi:MAG: hypothetical protein IPP15_12695 [Saprospiraceae bacterium]|uniref:Uncharacterized protein n=1 Tax=Candidatus Opimibacter skivensis TaxID=2982028 RepID=A0A9D7XND5_9BACT|nr:hypothetical protein [Candidatus Opimibacter skivensis]